MIIWSREEKDNVTNMAVSEDKFSSTVGSLAKGKWENSIWVVDHQADKMLNMNYSRIFVVQNRARLQTAIFCKSKLARSRRQDCGGLALKTAGGNQDRSSTNA